jgi:hypothetical protein
MITSSGTPEEPSRDDSSALLEVLTEKPSTAILTMQLAVFMLGVAPQAIKVFGIQGSPVTQVLAAIFLYSAGVPILTSLCGPDIQHGYSLAAKWMNTTPPPEHVRPITERSLFGQVMFLHVVLYTF